MPVNRSRRPLALLIGPALLFAACGTHLQSNPTGPTGNVTAAASVDAQGNCTAAFVSAYNGVLHQASFARAQAGSGASQSQAQIRSTMQLMHKACVGLFGKLHSVVQCRAQANGQVIQVSSNDHTAVCAGTTGSPKPSTGASGDASSAQASPLSAPSPEGSGTATPLNAFGPGQTISVITVDPAAGNGACTGALESLYAKLEADIAATTKRLIGPTSAVTPYLQKQAVRDDCFELLSALSANVECTLTSSSAPSSASLNGVSSSTLNGATLTAASVQSVCSSYL